MVKCGMLWMVIRCLGKMHGAPYIAVGMPAYNRERGFPRPEWSGAQGERMVVELVLRLVFAPVSMP